MFKSRLWSLDEHQKRILVVILRLLIQDKNAVAVNLLKGLLRERMAGCDIIQRLQRVKTSTQIDIIYECDNISLCNQDVLKV